jgi:glycerol-3-phosphate dehydrogenase
MLLIAGNIGMLDINTSDGRFLFFLPWEGSTLVGTTDRKGKATSQHGPPEEEIQWILNEVQKYLSDDLMVRRSDVLSAWQGFRPLASDPNAPPGSPVSRDHVISTNPKTGITFITGGKWTTYREMAQDVLDKVIPAHSLDNKAGPCITDRITLRGGQGYTRNVPIRLVQKYGVSEDTAKHLARTYGMHAFEVCEMADPTHKRWPRFGNKLIEGYPYINSEIAYACRNEMVITVKDMLTLRTRIAYLNKDAALAVAPKVADLMAKELKWSKRERDRQLKEAVELINTFGGPYPNKQYFLSESIKTIKDVRGIFRTFDHDKTGYVDFTEFQDIVKELGIPFANEKEAMKAFKKIDTKGDDKIYEDEFVAWWESARRDKFKENLGEKFKLSQEKLSRHSTSGGVGFG